MNKKALDNLELTPRTPRMVGREEEARRLQACLKARGERHVMYYWAHGGLGKTRLLEELQFMVDKAGPGFHSSGIIDLYHTDTHSTSDVERAIVEGLDPEKKYFAHYRQERDRFELLRERGTDPGVLEKRRQVLSQLFVKDCREMALDARKLVICFDTVELLQYESSVIEEKAGLENVDARVKPWLLSNLSQLANVLVVFAGRPKKALPNEAVDHQARLVADFQKAFGSDLTIVELEPFDLKETSAFISALTKGVEIVPDEILPVVHRLTGGRPIYLHLIVDLLQTLALEPGVILDEFSAYIDLVDAPEDDPRLDEARKQVETHILRALIEKTGKLGEYLRRIALMPKGVDAEMLHQTLGWPHEETEQLLIELDPLSFTKRFKTLPGAERLHGERLYLHDEMYSLLTWPEVMPYLRLAEREVAHMLVTNYYDPRIKQLEEDISRLPPGERIDMRERLQKLQVERLYYSLVRDICGGYAEYKRLSDQANRHRWVGYSMRLLDEFLRLYNLPERREQFEIACIPYEQVQRESAQMWVERFHWWGHYKKVIDFSGYVLECPDDFYIRPKEDIGIIGNICALWARAEALTRGYDFSVVERAQALLDQLPSLSVCDPDQTLARARLATSIGYQFRLGGALNRAAAYYVEANAAFRKFELYPDELANLLNNLAFVYAKQGRMALARTLAHEALRINEEMKNEYSTGLTLSTLATIARMRGNYPTAVAYGEEALDLFRELEDTHGTALAYLSIAFAKRRMAKHEIEKGRREKLEEAERQMLEASRSLQNAIEITSEAGHEADTMALRSELGRVYRDLGHIADRIEGREQAMVYYRQSERELKDVLEMEGWSIVEKADTLQDLADVIFASGDPVAAEQYLTGVEELIGAHHVIIPGEKTPGKDLPHEYFAPLGKVSMLRGQMAFEQEKLIEAIRSFVLAYAYFMHFSPDAAEMDTMIEYLYNYLRVLPVERQQKLIDATLEWARQHDMGVDVGPFVELLGDLLGV